MMDVTEGRPVQRHELRGLPPDEAAATLGHDLSAGGGVSIEPDVVVVHLPDGDGVRQVRHQVEG